MNISCEGSKHYYEMGICVYAVDYLFSKIESLQDKNFHIKISYLEIYNEQVIDLLVEKSSSNLMIVEDVQKGILVPDLTEYDVKSSRELISLIIKGNSKRTMAPTGENQFSSRSHAILQIIIEQKTKIRDLKEEILSSKFLLVDLAGSERSGLEKGIRTHEGKNINKSLLSLGNCINILSDKSKKGAFVPYRDSKLTRLLKDSLAGNIMSVMIACVSPSPTSYDETVNTLKYALKARKIEKSIHKNSKEVEVHISQYKDIIDSLKSEIEQLKLVIQKQNTITNKQMVQIENIETNSNNKTILETNQVKKIEENKKEPNNLQEKENDKRNHNEYENLKGIDKDNEKEKMVIDRSSSQDKNEKNLYENKICKNNKNDINDNFIKSSRNDRESISTNYYEKKINKNSNTIKNSKIKNGINVSIGNSMEISNMKKISFNNNRKIPAELVAKENTIEGSNLIMFSNNACLLSNQNVSYNVGKINSFNNNINRSNGRASSSVSKNNNNTYVGKENSNNTSNISGNNQAISVNNNAGIINTKVSVANQNNSNNNINKISTNFNYTKSNTKKAKKYSEMCRHNNNNNNNSNIISNSTVSEKEKVNNVSLSPEQRNQILIKNQKENVYSGNENYGNYKRFIVKNGEDEYDIDELAKNIDCLYNDKMIYEEILDKGSNDKAVCEKYKLIQGCFEKYLEIINDKLVEIIEHSMVLKINIKEILDLNLMNNNNITKLNQQLYNLEKKKIDNPSKISDIDLEIIKMKEELKNIQIAIEENDKMKDNVSESLLKSERNKTMLKQILLKLLSKKEVKNGSNNEAFILSQKENEEFPKNANSTNKNPLQVGSKEKENQVNGKFKDFTSEVDYLKQLLEEKEKQIKEISQKQNNFNKINEYLEHENIIAENVTEEDISIRHSDLKNVNQEKININAEKDYKVNFINEKNNLIPTANPNNPLVTPIYDSKKLKGFLNNYDNTQPSYINSTKTSITDNINNIRNNLISESNKGKNNLYFNNDDEKDSNKIAPSISSNSNPNNNNNYNQKLNSDPINNVLNCNLKRKISMPVNTENKNVPNLKQNGYSGNSSKNNNYLNLNLNLNTNIYSNNPKTVSQGQKINPIQSEKTNKDINSSNNINSKPNQINFVNNNTNNPYSNSLINKNNNTDLNSQEDRARNQNFIPTANINKNRGLISSVSRSPKNRNNKNLNYVNTYQPLNIVPNNNKDKDLNSIVNSNKSKFKEFDKIIQSQLNDVVIKNNAVCKKQKEINTQNRKRFKNNSTDNNTNGKNGNKKFPLFNHNGILDLRNKLNPNRKIVKFESADKLNIDNLNLNNNNNSINFSSEDDDNENIGIGKNKNIHNFNQNNLQQNHLNNQFEENPSELDLLQNLEKNFENPFYKPSSDFSNFNLIENKNRNFNKENLENKHRLSNPKQIKYDVNNIFLNNYEVSGSKNIQGVFGPNDVDIDKNLLEISEIFSTIDKNMDFSRAKNFYNKEKSSNNNIININRSNLNDDLTLILSPKEMGGLSYSPNVFNVELKSQMFIDKNKQKSFTPDNAKSNNLIENDNCNFINDKNVALYNLGLNKNSNDNNNLLISHENQGGLKEKIISHVNSNLSSIQNNQRLNSLNVQKFINSNANSFKNQNSKVKNSTSNDNSNSNNNKSNINSAAQSKYINNSSNNANFENKEKLNNFNEINKDGKNNLNPNNQKDKDSLLNFEIKPHNNIIYSFQNSNNVESKKIQKETVSSFNEFDINKNNQNQFNINNYKIIPNKGFTNEKETYKNIETNKVDGYMIRTNLKDFSSNIKEKKITSSDTELKQVKFTDTNNFTNVESLGSENKYYQVHSNRSTEKQKINLLKQARLERQTHRRSESHNMHNLDTGLICREIKIKPLDYIANTNEHRESCPQTFNSIMDSNKFDTRGFNKNTVDFFNEYKKNKNCGSNYKSGEVNMSQNHHFISEHMNTNIKDLNINDKEINELTLNCRVNKGNNCNNSNVHFAYASKFASNNCDNQKSNMGNLMINSNNEINSLILNKFSGTTKKRSGLDVVDEGPLEVMDEEKMTIEEDSMRNVNKSKNPRLLHSLENK